MPEINREVWFLKLIRGYWPRWAVGEYEVKSWLKALAPYQEVQVERALENVWRSACVPGLRFRKLMSMLGGEERRERTQEQREQTASERAESFKSECWDAFSRRSKYDKNSWVYGPLHEVTAERYWRWQVECSLVKLRSDSIPPAFLVAVRHAAYLDEMREQITRAGIPGEQIEKLRGLLIDMIPEQEKALKAWRDDSRSIRRIIPKAVRTLEPAHA